MKFSRIVQYSIINHFWKFQFVNPKDSNKKIGFKLNNQKSKKSKGFCKNEAKIKIFKNVIIDQ